LNDEEHEVIATKVTTNTKDSLCDPQEKMVNIIMMQMSTPQLQRDVENAVMQAIID
jgi:hypothetical protein